MDKAKLNKGFCSHKKFLPLLITFSRRRFHQRKTGHNSQRSKTLSTELKRRRLKDTAVPSVFPNAPSYHSTPPSIQRQTSATSASKRQRLSQDRLEARVSDFLDSDRIASLGDLKSHLSSSDTCLPSGFLTDYREDSIYLFYISTDGDFPKIKASFIIRGDLTITLIVNDQFLPRSNYSDIASDSVSTFSQVLNLMARVKFLSDCTDEAVIFDYAGEIMNLMERWQSDTESMKLNASLAFLIEQIALLSKSKFARSYSPELMVMAYQIFAASYSAYNFLYQQQLLCLPSICTLRKLTRKLSTDNGLQIENYLRLRVGKLDAFDCNVLLMIDEVYLFKRIEYSGNKIYGVTDDLHAATTILCFMVKSIKGKYRDVVSLFPINILTAEKLRQCFEDTMKTLRNVGLNVIGISVDSASVNRKFYSDICNGNLQTHVTDPVTERPIFLLFDPVHGIKNVYNNFQKKKSFSCPALQNYFPDGCSPKFSDIADLYEHESCMTLKKAYRLNPTTLQPKSIEKTSAKLALNVFAESTRDALLYYANHEDKPWNETACFITLIVKLWTILNVKSPMKGKHKLNSAADPVRHVSDWKLDFLDEFADFLQVRSTFFIMIK